MVTKYIYILHQIDIVTDKQKELSKQTKVGLTKMRS